MLLNRGVGEDSWESLGQQGSQTSQTYRKSTLNIHWKDWYKSWSSSNLVTWLEDLTHWKWSGCWQRLRAWGEGGDRGWDGSMASSTQWTWVWANSGSQWRTGKTAVLQIMGWQRVGHDLVTELQQLLYCSSLQSACSVFKISLEVNMKKRKLQIWTSIRWTTKGLCSLKCALARCYNFMWWDILGTVNQLLSTTSVDNTVSPHLSLHHSVSLHSHCLRDGITHQKDIENNGANSCHLSCKS